jgi:hypothetical protein
VKIVHLADHICKTEEIGWAGGIVYSGEMEDMCSEIGLTNDGREKILKSLKAEVADTKEFFGIATPRKRVYAN